MRRMRSHMEGVRTAPFLPVAAALALAAFLPVCTPLHCLAHGHCGEHAVCTTSAEHAVPRCRCLLGYSGNGKTCADDGHMQLVARSAVERTVQGKRRIVVERCTGGGAPLPPPPAEPAGHHEHHPIAADSTLEVADLGRRGACLKAACDFDHGACAYRNDRRGHWQTVEIGQGNSAAAVSSSGSHHLVSPHFILSQAALVRFDYFVAAGDGAGSFRLYSRSTTARVWTGAERPEERDAWRTGLALLGAGRHQLIFAAESLGAGQLVAMDNVVLVDSDGHIALCE